MNRKTSVRSYERRDGTKVSQHERSLNGDAPRVNSNTYSPPKQSAQEEPSFGRETYSAHWYDHKEDVVSFNLYPMDAPDIDMKQTIQNIMDNMNAEHLEELREEYAKAGIYLHELKWYSPRQYNFKGDNVDVVIEVTDPKQTRVFIQQNASKLQRLLDSNKSYDGYMSFTAVNVAHVLEKFDRGDLDPMVVDLVQRRHEVQQEDDVYDQFAWSDFREDERVRYKGAEYRVSAYLEDDEYELIPLNPLNKEGSVEAKAGDIEYIGE